jgi:hypothetical protein
LAVHAARLPHPNARNLAQQRRRSHQTFSIMGKQIIISIMTTMDKMFLYCYTIAANISNYIKRFGWD